MMSFRLSREECAEIVAEEFYEWHRSLLVDSNGLPLWRHAPAGERTGWIGAARKAVTLISPAIALDVLLDTKAQIVVKPPKPDTDMVRHVQNVAIDALWGLRTSVREGEWKRGLEPGDAPNMKPAVWDALRRHDRKMVGYIEHAMHRVTQQLEDTRSGLSSSPAPVETAQREGCSDGALEALLALRKSFGEVPWTDGQKPGIEAALNMINQDIRNHGGPEPVKDNGNV